MGTPPPSRPPHSKALRAKYSGTLFFYRTPAMELLDGSFSTTAGTRVLKYVPMLDDLLQVRSIGVNFHVLRDADGLYLIDGRFFGGEILLRRALKDKGWDCDQIFGHLAWIDGDSSPRTPPRPFGILLQAAQVAVLCRPFRKLRQVLALSAGRFQ